MTQSRVQSKDNLKDSGIGDPSPVIDEHNQQALEAVGVQNIDSRKEGEIAARIKEQATRFDQPQHELQRINRDN